MATQVPAASKPPQHKEVENFSEAERAEWLKTGAMPALEEEKVPPVKKDDTQASSTPVKESAGSGPATKSAEEKEAEKELNFKALRERTNRLEAELEEFRTGKKKPEEKKAEPTGPKLLELPKRPSELLARVGAEHRMEFAAARRQHAEIDGVGRQGSLDPAEPAAFDGQLRRAQ